MLKLYDAFDEEDYSSSNYNNRNSNKFLSAKELKLIKNFNVIVHNNIFYFGYCINDNKLQIFTSSINEKNEFLSFDIKDIINICTEYRKNSCYIDFYLNNREESYFVFIEEDYEKEIILTLTSVISKHKDKYNSNIRSL